ncbi:hypothetical protein FF098_005950 [Parvularcula flava]|uniref:Uncharacterized protein n=1 Tax=Aquisalinus luteolus TaxID=1566827 RepID=A0A8J3A185_9PROT|nr:hypothetical protein [Aquisalinus luteolus]NHK27441.1 hypothetical protein [Aquisalinus luteolus]GGH95447.1 hypothetical protein GCM10011355_12010 [Aquisalinus luteolus]
MTRQLLLLGTVITGLSFGISSQAQTDMETGPEALIMSWHELYAQNPDATPITLKECKDTGYSASCTFDTGIPMVQMSVEVPVEEDEIAFRFARLMKAGDSVEDTNSVVPAMLADFTDPALEVLGWTGGDEAEASTEMSAAIREDSLPALQTLGPDNDDILTDHNWAIVSGNFRPMASFHIASYSLKILADGPYLYDEAIAEARTDKQLKRAAERLKATAETMQGQVKKD